MEKGVKCSAFRLCLNFSKSQQYGLLHTQNVIYEPHGNHKSKTYDRHTKNKEKVRQNTIDTH